MKRIIGSLAALFMLQACGGETSSDSHAVVFTANGWDNYQKIPVCFVNRSQVSEELAADIQNHVEAEFESKTKVRFVGWSDCRQSDFQLEMIRIYFNRVHTWTVQNGRFSFGGGISWVGANRKACNDRCNGGTMRLDVGKKGRYPSAADKRAVIRTATKATALHEFGHAVGLQHEHERVDAKQCNNYARLVDDDRFTDFIGAYDDDSVMNYCNSNALGLSKGDVAGIAYLTARR